MIGRACLAFALSLLAGADGPPAIRRVRVPASKVGALLPAGAERRGMTVEAFEALARSATEGADRVAARGGARLLRARHRARWEAGVLIGRTELRVEGPARGAAEVGLDPWSAAVVDEAGTAASRLRSTADGALGIVVDSPGASTLELAWELVARAGTGGASFALALPRVPVSSLSLDLPAACVPESPGLSWRGPTPGVAPDRRLWEAVGAAGPIELRVRPPVAAEASACWVEGMTRVDVAEWGASWRADWSVDFAAAGPFRLRVDLDPGLSVVDVSGPAVVSHQLEGPGRLVIALAPAAAGPSPVSVRASTPVPETGPWSVPSARVVGAGWTGGETVVRVGPGRVVQGCQERHGRRAATPPDLDESGPRTGSTFVFVAESPGPVAELTFRRPWTDASATVRGRVEVGPVGARLEALVAWSVDRGRLTDPAIDLPAGWLAERVQVLGLDEPTTWHAEARPGGGSRLLVSLPPAIDDSAEVRMTISATADGTGPLDLPRLRPVGVRVEDDLWAARPEPGLNLRPIEAEGLAWIDPEALGFGPDAALGGLAWRWTTPGATARVERRSVPAASAARTLTVATVDRSTARLAWSYRGPRPEQRTLTLGLTDGSAADPAWRLMVGTDGRPIPARRVVDADAARPGGPARWELTIPGSAAAEIHIVADADLAWRGEGPVPLLVPPPGVDAPSTVIVAVPWRLEAAIRVDGLRPLATAAARRRAAPDLPAAGTDGPDRVHAFADADARPGRLILRTGLLAESTHSGFVREARLHTEAPPGGDTEQTLALEVLSTSDTPLDVELPAGSVLRHARLGGVAATPRRAGPSYRFDLGPGGPGARSLTLWYRSPRREGVRVAEQPTFSMPCLALTWSVGGGLDIVGVGGGLRRADPAGIEGWPHRLLGTWPTWGAPKASAGLDLAARGRPWPGSPTLGELLRGWDAAGTPVVVDRLALADAGRLPAYQMGPKPAGLDPAGALEREGLATYEPGGFAVVTTRDQAERWRSASRAELAAVSREALSALRVGHDAADRLASVGEWGGEVGGPTPIGGVGAVHRYVAAGWPAGNEARVEVVGTSRSARRWAGGLATLGVGLGLLRGRRRSLAVGIAAGVAMVAAAWGPDRVAPWASGVTCGSLALVAFGLGRRAKPRPVDPRAAAPSSRPFARVLAAGSTSLTLLACTLAATAQDRPTEPPIVALMPYEDLAELESPPRRVVLLQRDHDRLKRLAEATDAPPAATPRLSGASHRLRAMADGTLSLTTEADLDGDGPEAGGWAFPVGGGRELRAEIDGRAAPVRILDGGARAEVLAPAAGRHRLKLSRTFDDGPRQLPINPVAGATLVVEAAEGVARPEVLGARGRWSGSRVLLGPVDRLTIRRGATTAAPAGRGLVLWDATPVGDLARTRWTLDEPRGLDVVRLGLEPGWVVRSAAAPGLVDQEIAGTAGRPVWVGRFDPPLPAGATVAVDFWRPSAGPGAGIPRFELLDVERPSQLIGLRRRADWRGRLRGDAEADIVGDEEFLSTWGPLPADGLTFAGAARSAKSATVSPRLGFAPTGRTVRPSMAMDVAAGRVAFRLAAEVVDRAARGEEVELLIAPSWLLTRVQAPGLTDWSRPAPNRLSLRFDGPTAPERSVRVEGWLPVATRPLAAGPSAESMEVPWPSWPGAVELPGDLAITAPASASARLAMGPGVTLLGESSGASSTSPTRRYRGEGRGGLGPLRWSADPRRIAVAIRSELTLAPGSAEWRASARYQVAGGGCDTIALTLPRAWAEHARLEMPGGGFRQPSTEVVGDLANWTIRLDAPFWGSRTVLIRAVRPLDPDAPVEFPKLSPLGEGRVEIDLALSDEAGNPPATVGLVPVLDDRFPAPADSPPNRRVYHAQRPDWSLKVDPPSMSTAVEALALDAAYTVVAEPGGAVSGRADFRLKPGSGGSLVLGLPAGVEALAVLVDGVPSRPALDPSGKVVVPLDPSSSRAVQLVWRADTPSLPIAPQADLPYRLALRCGDDRTPIVAGATRSAPAPGPTSTTADLGRIREVGNLHTFAGKTGPGGLGPSITLEAAPAGRLDNRPGFWLSIGLAALAAAVVPLAARGLERRPLLAWVGLSALPAAAWLGVEPAPLVAALGLFLAGRSVGR